MKDLIDLFSTYIPGTNIRRKPICKTCIYRKLGLATICKKYKRIPSNVQHGKYCEKYVKNEVK